MIKVLQLIFGLFVSCILVFWMARQVTISDLENHISTMNWGWMVPISLVCILQNYLRAVRWRYLLPRLEGTPPSTRLLFDSLMIGNLASYFLPFRAGEVIRPGVLVARSTVSFSSAMVSVVVERLFDLIFVLVTFFIVSIKQPFFVDGWILQGVRILSIMAVCLSSLILLVIFKPRVAELVLRLVLGFFKPLLSQRNFEVVERTLARLFASVFADIRQIARGKKVVVITFLTSVIWLMTAGFFYMAGYLFFVPPLSFGLLLMITVSLSVAAPSAPGFIGVYQTGCLAAFYFLKLPKDVGIAFGIVTHLVQYVLVIVFGVWCTLRNGFSLKDLLSKKLC